MKAVGAIPARLGSTRLPEKPLALLGGVPMVVRVAQAAARSCLDRVVVLTDAPRIQAAVAAHGLPCVLTLAHPSGTDRVACWAATQADADVILNIQGDEPLLHPGDLDALVTRLRRGPEAIATLYQPMDALRAQDPDAVKVTVGDGDVATGFSRTTISPVGSFFEHVGIYGFTRPRLLAFAALPQTAAELAERLEQLRAMDQGWPIAVLRARGRYRSVDTPGDLAAVRAEIAGDPAIG